MEQRESSAHSELSLCLLFLTVKLSVNNRMNFFEKL